jgi:hypothetical protein
MQPWITQFNSNKLQRRRLESTQFHSSNSSGEEDCLCISVPAEVEKKKKKLENSKPVVVEEKDNLHNSIPAPVEKMTKLHGHGSLLSHPYCSHQSELYDVNSITSTKQAGAICEHHPFMKH